MPNYNTYLPMSVLLPDTPENPVIAFSQTGALRFAVVERAHVQQLDKEFDDTGNYLLLDPISSDATWGVYVGKASPGGVKTRLVRHLATRESWTRAVIIQSDTTHGFHTAQVGWLEGRLYDLMNAAQNASLTNGNRPVDETLPAFDRNTLEQAILPIRAFLRLLGYDTASFDDEAVNDEPREETGQRSTSQALNKRYYGITIKQIVDAGILKPGTPLVSTNGTWPAQAEIAENGVLYDGIVYDKPNGAVRKAKNGGVDNGWDFWAVPTEHADVSLSTYREQYLAQKDERV